MTFVFPFPNPKTNPQKKRIKKWQPTFSNEHIIFLVDCDISIVCEVKLFFLYVAVISIVEKKVCRQLLDKQWK